MPNQTFNAEDMTSSPATFKAQTAYNTVSIRQTETKMELYAGEALQSAIDLQSPYNLVLRNLAALMTILLFIPRPKRVLILGTAGGSLVHFFQHHYADVQLTAVEIDAELLQLMHTRMQLPQADDRLTYVIDDAEHYLQHCQQKFDLIIVDLFIDNQSPDWLMRAESMQTINRCLSDQGGVAYNLMIPSEHAFKQYYRDLRQVYNRQTLCLPVDNLDNTLAFAFRYEIPERGMTEYMQNALQLSEAHNINYMEILSTIYTTNPGGQGVI